MAYADADPKEPAPTHGCMACKSQQPYTVETLPNRNTVWRCAVCHSVVNLIPGTYTSVPGEVSAHAPR